VPGKTRRAAGQEGLQTFAEVAAQARKLSFSASSCSGKDFPVPPASSDLMRP